jgi:ubiquinol-cytochrome c reductase cytochrome b subunit
MNLTRGEKAPIFPHFIFKDIVGFFLGFCLAYFLMFYSPSLVLEHQKFLPAKFLVTPEHIQPEWYFLAAYAILRAVPKKLGGVVSLAAFVVFLFVMPFLILFSSLS